MLSDTTIRGAKPKDKPYKLSDEKGLYLIVRGSAKLWRFDYRFGGKRKTLALGRYPEVSLRDARDRRDAARKQIAAGIDPSDLRKAEKASRTGADRFESIAREWLGKHAPGWAPTHTAKITIRLEKHVFPWIGSRPVAEITAPELLAVLRRIESTGALETAHRALQHTSQIIRYAVATGRAQRDPCGDLRGALPPVHTKKHFAAVTDPKHVGALLRQLDGYQGTFPVMCALRLAPLLFVRPGELRQARWSDVDLDAAEWRYRVTKTRQDHIVPLSVQAVAILRELYPLTGNGPFVFPSARDPDRAMSDNAVLSALRRLGIPKDEMCGHGFRAMARTILDEVLGFPVHLIEHQLAHAVRDPLGRSYNRTQHLPERRAMMQAWADYLDQLRIGTTNVIPLRGKLNTPD